MNCFRLLSVTLIVGGLVNFAVAQPFGGERGPDRDAARDFDRDSVDEFGRDSERDFPRGRVEGEGDFRRPGGPRGRGPQTSPMFEAIDADGDGVITNRELRKAAVALKTLDADGDGNITMEEASPARGPGRGGPGGPGGPGGDPNAMIDRIMENDKNGDGQLSPDEVPPQLTRMLYDADTNNDRVIDRAELEQAMQKMQNRFGGRGGPRERGRGNAGTSPEETFQRLMASDANGDGMLSPNEVPRQLMSRLRGADLNEDGFLNRNEIQQAVQRMGNRGRDRRPTGPPRDF